VLVSGAPALQLSDGRAAAYAGGSGTTALTFKYTVQPGDTASDLQITGLDISSGAIKDAAGNAITGSAAKDLQLKIDTTAPTVTSVAAMADNGATLVNAGHAITIAVNLSEAVTVTGTPTLALSDGAVATYVGGSGTNALSFAYIVSPGESSPDLKIAGLNLAGGAILDSAGNALADVIGDLGLVIDTTTPKV